MYNPVFLDRMAVEQRRRMQEVQAIARAYNQLEQKPEKSVKNRRKANHFFGWLFLPFEKRHA